MKTKMKLMVGLIAFTLFASAVSQAQWGDWYNFVAPAKSSAAKLNMAAMVKALPSIEQSQPIPTNGVKLVAQVNPVDVWINPENLIFAHKINVWKGVEIPKDTKDLILKSYKGQKGQGIACILKVSEADGGNPLKLKNMRIYATIFNPETNEDIKFLPSAIRMEGYSYKRDREGELIYNDGSFAKTNKVVVTSMSALKRSRATVDYFTLYVQFATVSINADNVPGFTNQEKLLNTYDLCLTDRSEIFIAVEFVDSEDEEFVTDSFYNFFWVTEFREPEPSAE